MCQTCISIIECWPFLKWLVHVSSSSCKIIDSAPHDQYSCQIWSF